MASSLLAYETNIPVFNLSALSLKDLDQHLHHLVKTERKIMDQVLKVITEMDLRQGYLQLGFGSLFSYLVGIGYSESAAQRRITASRVMQRMNRATRNSVEQSLKEGSLNLTQLSKVNSLFDYLEKLEKAGETIEINTAIPKLMQEIQGQNARTTDTTIENTIKAVLPSAKQNELSQSKKTKIKKHISGTVKITLELSSELNKKLQKVLDLKSHTIPDGNVLILFEKLLDAEIKKHEGPKKKSQAAIPSADQNQNKYTPLNKKTSLNPAFTFVTNVSTIVGSSNCPVKTKRKHISIIVKRRVYQKAGYQCEYISPITGQRCPETRFLTLDHIIPVINWPI